MFIFNLTAYCFQDVAVRHPLCQELYMYSPWCVLEIWKGISGIRTPISCIKSKEKKYKDKDSDLKVPENIQGMLFINFSELWNRSYLICSRSKEGSPRQSENWTLTWCISLGTAVYSYSSPVLLYILLFERKKNNSEKNASLEFLDAFTSLWEFLKTFPE